MAWINEHFLKLGAGYLFPEIARRVKAYTEANPALAARVVRCGIGDVTEPLPEAAVKALREGVEDLARRERFQGYGPPTGHEFVRASIAKSAFRDRGVDIQDDEIFLSDGSKPDASHFLQMLGDGNTIAVPDPVYPVYVDTNVMAGNTGALKNGRYEGLVYMDGTPANGFVPEPPAQSVDVAYLCFPNNPTGSVISRAALTRWVEWALKHGTLILYDAAYEAYIRDPAIPRSIFEIPGARQCAVEFRSFSKNGGFTGLRCGFTVVPKDVSGRTRDGRSIPFHGLWSRRWSTCSNGVSWPVQKAAAALGTPEGQKQMKALCDFYLANAAILRKAVADQGLQVWGGENAPYVWLKCPVGLSSWDAFDLLLREAQLVTTPGAGFGNCGEGFLRVSAFNSRANVEEAGRRLALLTSAASSR
ncbi:MAG: LL-diaminopimelate aminotransferase [Planctomycetes bacterium]|nr:LL-diaminopimelate aminotransferase [Planctomycetota bacterium]